MFAFVVPQATTLTYAGGGQGCVDLGGYHSESANGVVYSVNLQCNNFFGGGFGGLTVVLSHEEGEAATDAHVLSTLPGWYSDDFYVSEVGDLCTGLNTAAPVAFADPDGGTVDENYLVSRFYSAKTAAVGASDPCLPAPATPYFSTAMSPRTVTVNVDSTGQGSATADFEPFAYGEVGTIKWQVYAQVQGVTIVPSKGSGVAGDTVPVTFHVSPAAQPGTYSVNIYSQSKTGGTNLWFFPLVIQ